MDLGRVLEWENPVREMRMKHELADDALERIDRIAKILESYRTIKASGTVSIFGKKIIEWEVLTK